MKKAISILTLSIMFISAFAQNNRESTLGHDNLDFELWENNGIEDVPTGFIGLNCIKGENSIQKNSYFLHLETKYNIMMAEMYPGMASIGRLTQSFEPIPGEPYSDRPERLTGYVQYNVQGNDMTGIVIELYAWDNDSKITVASADTAFTGNTSEWNYIDMKIDYTSELQPDTIWIGFSTGDPDSEYTEGSSLSLDNFSLEGTVNTEKVLKQTGLISIYPNPATDVVTIEHQHDNTATINLYSIDGRLQRRIKAAGFPQQLSTRNLPAGNYLISINPDGKTPEKRQLIIR